MGNIPSAPHQPLQGRMGPAAFQRGVSFRRSHGRSMDRLRRSFRDSFRRRKGGEGGGGVGGVGGQGPESARPHQWQADEAAVRASTCSFPVKYLGCVEVFESRGMQVCEEALKVLRASRRRAVRAALHVSGDGLRVVEDDTKGLIVDQTIEKVSFCAPDRNHERGFSYICRDGTTRRWMCHGFLAVRDPGERLSHAVGCAFSACLERKQRRDKDTLIAAELTKSHHHKILSNGMAGKNNSGSISSPPSTVTVAAVAPSLPSAGSAEGGGGGAPPNPFAIARPHAAPHMLERQGSFRGFSHLNNNSPFKRQMSLRISDLPSNLERLRCTPSLPPVMQTVPTPAPIQTVPPEVERDQQVAALCQQVSRGLHLLSFGGEGSGVPLEEVAVDAGPELPAPDQWLGRLTGPSPPPPSQAPRRAPGLNQRARSLGGDPFDAEWAVPPRPTNPFLQRAI